MPESSSSPFGELLSATPGGDGAAASRLWTLLYTELHGLARGKLRHEAGGPGARQATSLIHEAWIRLADAPDLGGASQGRFFAAAATVMRHVVVDDARAKKRQKRGGKGKAVTLEAEPAVLDRDPTVVLAVEEALAQLERVDARKARLVTLRYFAGMTVEETAVALEISPRQVNKEWEFTKAWLHRQLSAGLTGQHPAE